MPLRRMAVLMGAAMMVCAGSLQAQTETPVPTEEAAPAPLKLTLWLPDLMVAPDNTEARDEFNRQIDAFTAETSNVTVDIRLKKVGDVGGIMATLRAASSVAPGALPDVTLLRRQDLVAAARDGLIQSLEGKVPSATLLGLDTALKLGQVNNQLYGIPYMLELQHTIYRIPADSELDYSAWDYASMLQRKEPFVFAAARPTGINDVLYLQYLAAGGNLSDDGNLLLNPTAVRATLDFYEQARKDGLLSDTLLSYGDTSDYLSAFEDRSINSAVVSSTTYLKLLRNDPDLKAAPIPAENGSSASLLNGWMWVVVTSDPARQEQVVQLINAMMQPEYQTACAQTINMLPSARQVLLDSLSDRVDKTLYDSLLESAVLPLTEGDGGTLARSLQDAFAEVISGTKTAKEAADGIQAE